MDDVASGGMHILLCPRWLSGREWVDREEALRAHTTLPVTQVAARCFSTKRRHTSTDTAAGKQLKSVLPHMWHVTWAPNRGIEVS